MTNPDKLIASLQITRTTTHTEILWFLNKGNTIELWYKQTTTAFCFLVKSLYEEKENDIAWDQLSYTMSTKLAH